jgi:hypothetical protein
MMRVGKYVQQIAVLSELACPDTVSESQEYRTHGWSPDANTVC